MAATDRCRTGASDPLWAGGTLQPCRRCLPGQPGGTAWSRRGREPLQATRPAPHPLLPPRQLLSRSARAPSPIRTGACSPSSSRATAFVPPLGGGDPTSPPRERRYDSSTASLGSGSRAALRARYHDRSARGDASPGASPKSSSTVRPSGWVPRLAAFQSPWTSVWGTRARARPPVARDRRGGAARHRPSPVTRRAGAANLRPSTCGHERRRCPRAASAAATPGENIR